MNRRSKGHCRKDVALPDKKDEDRDNEKLIALIDEHKQLLRRTIESNVHNPVDVDDVYQETVLAILEHFRKGIPVKHPKAWMTKIFINPAVFGSGVSIADAQHQAVVVQEILDAVARMKPIHRNVGTLHIQGYTTPEISELLEIPEGAVTSRLRKFRQLIWMKSIFRDVGELHIQGYTIPEISELLEIREGLVISQLQKLRIDTKVFTNGYTEIEKEVVIAIFAQSEYRMKGIYSESRVGDVYISAATERCPW